MAKHTTFSKSNKIKKSLFRQYLTLYIITAFLPAALASISLNFSYRALEREIVTSNQIATTLIKEILDTKFNELDSVLQQISQEVYLTQYHLKEDPADAVSCLRRLTSLQDCIDNVIITTRNGNCVYTATGVIRDQDLGYHSFINDYIQSGMTPEKWIADLRQTTLPVYVYANTIKNPQYLYYFSPVYSNFAYDGSTLSRTVALLIKQEFIRDLFRSSQSTNEESILLLDSNFNLLSFFSQNSQFEEINAICEKLKEYELNEDTTYFESEDGIIYFLSYSTDSELYYIRFLPKSVAYQPLQEIQTYTTIILFIVVIIGLLLIFWGMMKNFLPIHNLATSILEKETENSRFVNELDLFRQAHEDNIILSDTLNQSKQSLINHFLAMLIQGNFSTEEAFQNACNNIKIKFNLPFYCVCCVLFESNSNEDMITFESVLAILNTNLPEKFVIYAKDLLLENKLLLFVNSDYSDLSSYEVLMRHIKKHINEEMDIETSVAMGTLCDSFDKIGKSYLDCMNALDYRFLYGKNCFINHQMHTENINEPTYPNSDINLLYSALINHEAELARAAITRMHNYTKSQNCSIHTAKYLCYDAFSVVKKIPALSTASYSSTISKALDITRLTTFDTIDDFFYMLMEISLQTINIANPTSNDNVNIGLLLKQYVDENCFRYNFQINFMAEHFNLSPQNMRTTFKEYTGVALSEYIANLKLDEALRLLRDSDLNLENIVTQIGNTDVSGFIRFFKKRTGLTPGQYRKSIQIHKIYNSED